MSRLPNDRHTISPHFFFSRRGIGTSTPAKREVSITKYTAAVSYANYKPLEAGEVPMTEAGGKSGNKMDGFDARYRRLLHSWIA
jgi:hypothetical protein